MAFDERLAERLRTVTAAGQLFAEQKMFGAIAFLLNGNVCVGIWKDSLIVRIGPEAYAAALAESYVDEFDITGKPMKGWVLVRPEAIAEDADLEDWVRRAVRFAMTLPAK